MDNLIFSGKLDWKIEIKQSWYSRTYDGGPEYHDNLTNILLVYITIYYIFMRLFTFLLILGVMVSGIKIILKEIPASWSVNWRFDEFCWNSTPFPKILLPFEVFIPIWNFWLFLATKLPKYYVIICLFFILSCLTNRKQNIENHATYLTKNQKRSYQNMWWEGQLLDSFSEMISTHIVTMLAG